MLTNLAVNHTLQVDGKIGDQGNIVYNASSPDELALVNGARFLGITYTGRNATDNNIFTVSFKGEETRSYELLTTIEFNSTRKRMTSVFKDMQNGDIRVMCKGADSIILPLLKDRETPAIAELCNTTIDYMDNFAKEGLRTLLIAEKVLTQKEYNAWNEKYTEALNAMVDRDDKVAEVAESLEFDFDLVGSTALEDKLQDGVPETIEMIRKAGIKLWVLTGDKIETAINIGYSCKLLDDDLLQPIIDGTRSVEINTQICNAENDKNSNCNREMGVIVSGESLLKIFANEKLLKKFIGLADAAEVVLACRVSPKQKAELVAMIRNEHAEAITLGIGDGANDVNMICEAHVGVGI